MTLITISVRIEESLTIEGDAKEDAWFKHKHTSIK